MRVYLDTSVISALFDERNPERKSLTEAFFHDLGNFVAYCSELTILEIDRTPDSDLRHRMKEVLSQMTVVEATEETEELAREYIRHGAVPESYSEDAYHIAIAVTNEMDALLSWNFKHIVRRKTRDTVQMVNTLHRFGRIEIMTPAELL